jgi:2,4-dienoyl-CoA reductase-like NADH-dependent reductase (Old Yellow Enzyme family)
MSLMFPHLFSPLTMRHVTLKHRLVFGTHTPNMSVEKRPGERHLAYYRARARGGAAMISVEPLPIHRTAVVTRGQFHVPDASMIPHFRRLTDMCHAEGVVVSQQVFHIGAHLDMDNAFEAAWSPSGTASFRDGEASHAMTVAEIEELLDAYERAASIIQQSGYDGIEINAGYNSLIDSFWSPLANRRDDAWGGSFERRLRFPIELLARVRKQAGDNFLIGMTLSGDDNMPGGLDLAARQEIVAAIDRHGLVDYFPIKTGSYYDFPSIIPPFMLHDMQGPPLAAGMKQVVRHAKIQAESRVKTPANAEQVLAAGHADMISLVRGQIADPQLARKASEDRPQDIRPCISCNQLCLGRRSRDYWFSCLVNPSVGREYLWGEEPYERARAPRRVLVVGAGPAGLETARVAAERGHAVTLVDAGDGIGGQFRLAAIQPRRGEITQLLAGYYQAQIAKLGIDLRLNTWLDKAAVLSTDADAIVIATGSRPAGNGFQRALPQQARLPGVDAPDVYSIDQVLTGAEGIGRRVLLLDDVNGWLPASGTALFLAEHGHAVTIVTAAADVALSLEASAADEAMREALAHLNVGCVTSTALLGWADGVARFRSLLDDAESVAGFDALVLATTNVPDRSLADALADCGREVHAIGDCVAARTAAMAIYDGRTLGRLL